MRLSEDEYARLLLRRTTQPVETPRIESGAGSRGTGEAVPEKRFQAQLLQVARREGWIAYHTFDSRKSPEGFPDVMLVRPEPGRGPVYAWELKTARGKVTMAQQMWLTALEGKTISAAVVRPADFADLVRLLQAPQRP